MLANTFTITQHTQIIRKSRNSFRILTTAGRDVALTLYIQYQEVEQRGDFMEMTNPIILSHAL